MKTVDWSTVNTAGANKIPTAGGYHAVIRSVSDNEAKEFLLIRWDYTDPEYAGFNERTNERMGFWPACLLQSYKTKALPFFKRFKNALEESNPRYAFDEQDLQAIVGLEIGVVLGEEEYRKSNGNIGRKVYVASVASLDDIDSGNYKIPPFKTLGGSPVAAPNFSAEPSFESLEEEDAELPF